MSNNYKSLQIIILIMCSLGAFGSFIIGFNAFEDNIAIGLIIVFLGLLGAIITFAILINFFELVEKVSLIEMYLRNGASNSNIQTNIANKTPSQEEPKQEIQKEATVNPLASKPSNSSSTVSSPKKTKGRVLTVEEKLKFIQEDFESGLIPEEEYLAQKAEILGEQ